MEDNSIAVANERRKASSNALYNLGSALAGAAAVKLYSDGAFSVAFALWSVGAAWLILTGWLWLSLLEKEA